MVVLEEVCSVSPVSEKETWTGEDEDSEPIVRRRKKNKFKPPGQPIISGTVR